MHFLSKKETKELCTDQISFFTMLKKVIYLFIEPPYLELCPTRGNQDILKSWNLVIETHFFCKIPYLYDIIWPSWALFN